MVAHRGAAAPKDMEGGEAKRRRLVYKRRAEIGRLGKALSVKENSYRRPLESWEA
jgi:hypothetical protein